MSAQEEYNQRVVASARQLIAVAGLEHLSLLDGLHELRCRLVDEQEVLDDKKRLVRELDVALNGEDGAAPQASLCDIVGQVKDKRWTLVRTE